MLLGRHPLAAIWFYVADVARAATFYRDVLGLTPLEEASGAAHFDAGGIRLSLHPAVRDDLPPRGSFLVFIAPDGIDDLYEELWARGVEFEGPPGEEEFGRVCGFRDPDGHQLWLWQPPTEGDPRYPQEAALVRHYEALVARLR